MIYDGTETWAAYERYFKMKQSQEHITNYKDIRDKLNTFTIVNCVARKFPYNFIGHTAVLYKCQETGQLMVFESTTLNKFTGISGVQLTPFGIWLDKYPGKVYVRIPEFEISKRDQDWKLIIAQEFIQNHLGTSYPDLKTRTGRFKLYLAVLDFKLFGVDIFTYKGGDTGLFCTQLVVMFYRYCGLSNADEDIFLPPNEYEPDDTRNYGLFDFELKNCKLSDEICIKD
jgi:hypothetical protein